MKVHGIVKFRYFILFFNLIFSLHLFFPSLYRSQGLENSLNEEFHDYLLKGDQLENLFPDSAIYYYQKALEILNNDQLDNDILESKIDLFIKVGRIFHLQSKYSFANDYYSRALSESQAILNDSLMAESNFNIAEINLENGSYANAVTSYITAKELFRKINYVDGIFWSDIGLGIIYRELGNAELSKKHYGLAIKLGESENKKDYIAISYNNLGNLYKQIGEYDTAIKYLQLALKSFENYGEEKFVSDCLEGIGEVYAEINNHERAIEYFKRSTEIAEALNDNYRLFSKYANTANSYVQIGDNKNALMYFSKTIELAQSIGDKARLSEVLIMVSDFYKSSGDLNLALLNLNKSLLISKEVGDTVSIATALNSLSELYFQKKDYKAAYQNALKSFQISSQKNLMKTLAKSSLSLSRILEIQGNYEDSFYYFKIYTKTKDALLNSEKLKILEDTEAKYNTERIKSEKLELENTSLASERQLQNQNILIFFLGVVLLISLVGIGFYLFRKRIERRKSSQNSLRMKRRIDLLNSQINEKNRELTSKALLISQNNEVLRSVVNSIEDYLKDEKRDKNELKRLKKQLQEIYEEKSWDDFLQHFEQVHPQFYKNLLAKCDDLSPTEQKVCAFLKMNLNTKEISQITSQTTKAIEVMRSRIRKKMDIPHEESLTKTIQIL
jgi:tetratricopeptide (TPR) repeat protein